MTFAKRLDEILKARGKTQSDLARHLGIQPQSVGQWDKGVKPTRPRGARLEKIASFLQVTVPELMAPQGSPFKEIELGIPAQPTTDRSPRRRKLAKGADNFSVADAWQSLPQEDKDVLKGFINVMLARRGLPPIEE